jgi:hypothetical protein
LGAEEPEQQPSLQVGALSGSLRLDGVLDEPDWSAAPAAAGLTMVEPRQGSVATALTTVKVLAGPKALVFGIRCQDPEPSRIVAFTKERDGDLDLEDHVVVVLDPFRDGRSGYVFAVNPGGARLDALVNPGGESVDKNWDGEWEAATSRTGAGWTAEIRIPIQTLSFKRDLREWALNVQRRIQRLQETDRWASARQDFEVFQTSRAGLLAGLPTFDLGLGLAVRPSLVGGFQDVSPAAEDVANLLVGEKVVGWFQGRMEFGPRALGARSILGDPRSPKMQATMNLKIKFRESFRPFAPCVLQEEAHRWFALEPGQESPYMLLVAPVLDERRVPVSSEQRAMMANDPDLRNRVNVQRSTVPAVTHVDYSARIQTVDEDRNPSLARLLKTFFRRTGCPVLVNTSFNVRGEPIVCTPEDAYRCFLGTEMDALVMGDVVLLKDDVEKVDTATREKYLAQFQLD